MSQGPCVIAACRPWYRYLPERLREQVGRDFVLVGRQEDLTEEFLEELAPRYVFFPHWSWIIPRQIWSRHECVVFHMTDLPFGRGGSPLQNLIARGIYETKVTALRCEAGLDSGPVYLKKDLSLHGAAEEIYLRAANLVESMIVEILRTEPVSVPQQGEPTVFIRRTPEQGDISGLENLQQVHDFIRMLDAEGYPAAFLECGDLRLEFSRSALRENEIRADVTIRFKDVKKS